MVLRRKETLRQSRSRKEDEEFKVKTESELRERERVVSRKKKITEKIRKTNIFFPTRKRRRFGSFLF